MPEFNSTFRCGTTEVIPYDETQSVVVNRVARVQPRVHAAWLAVPGNKAFVVNRAGEIKQRSTGRRMIVSLTGAVSFDGRTYQIRDILRSVYGPETAKQYVPTEALNRSTSAKNRWSRERKEFAEAVEAAKAAGVDMPKSLPTDKKALKVLLRKISENREGLNGAQLEVQMRAAVMLAQMNGVEFRCLEKPLEKPRVRIRAFSTIEKCQEKDRT